MPVPGKPVSEMRSVLAQSLDDRWAKYTRELKRCRRRCTEKSVHDLRVATRRLICSLDLIMTVRSNDRLVKIRRELKKRLKSFGPLRDIQIQVLYVEKLLETYPELETFLTVLLLRERRAIKQIHRGLQEVRTASMEKVIAESRADFAGQTAGAWIEPIVRDAVVGVAAAAFARASDFRRRIDVTQPGTIHRLRVAFKKFRYMVEVLQPVLGWVSDGTLKALNAYQVRMGDIQDTEVLTSVVNAYALRGAKTHRDNLLRVHQELRRRHAALIDVFMESADELYTFWRPGLTVSARLPA
jgi:CHAD domain-containing protein